ncbi:MAG: ABC transporter ATP-binding protein [Spirochaetota bacterium]
MPDLHLENLVIKYGKVIAVDNLNLEVKDGELVTLLGPSGCGKTTTLRAVTGFLKPESGDIYVGERKITDIAPEKRGIGLVFQNYALWPHMTVFQNLAFGLQLKKISRDKIKKKVEEVLTMVKLEGYGDRYPRQLSGGQQQRVALARALVLEPDILLLDEPLSNLDALLREQMRFEIAQIHRQYGVTTIYVTHDQTEAMVISDRIIVLDKGRIMQQGTPEDIYSRPANKFVAGFMGTTNFIHGRVSARSDDYTVVATDDGLNIYGRGSGLKEGREVDVAIRPENIEFLSSAEAAAKKLNVFEVRVARATYVGELIDYELTLMKSIIRAKGNVRGKMLEEERVKIYLDPEHLPVLPG